MGCSKVIRPRLGRIALHPNRFPSCPGTIEQSVKMVKILMVVTSNSNMPGSDHKTGYWLEELAAPYMAFVAAGHSVTIATPAGGEPPCDSNSLADGFVTEDCKKFQADAAAQAALKATKKLSEINFDEFDGVMYPGGHGPLWDLVTDELSIKCLETFAAKGKPIGAVCHGPCVLKNVKGPDGAHILKGKKCTGFTDSEEKAVKLEGIVPFSLEQMMKEAGGSFTNVADWNSLSVVDGKLVTGQNPQSSVAVAQDLLKLF